MVCEQCALHIKRANLAESLLDLLETEKAIKSERIKASLRARVASGRRLGRPQTSDYKEILKMRASGCSFREIRKTLQVGMGTISAAIKKNPGEFC